MRSSPPVVALTQGDPAGVGPEILLKLVREGAAGGCRPLLVAERAALEAQAPAVLAGVRERLVYLPAPSSPDELELPAGEAIAVVDPLADRRSVTPGESGATDAAGALAALDLGIALVGAGVADALVTAPVSKVSIARHQRDDFRGHTDYLAEACGLERYGRDYLMAFLAPDLQVALLSTHLSLVAAIDAVRRDRIADALACLDRNAGGRVAVAGLNPHAGEEGLLGSEDAAEVAPAVALAREQKIDAHGPESPDALFSRARRGEFDWVLALYHDQGLIAVKTVAFGRAVNWTLGLPFIRTSVDHGTAFAIAGSGEADARPLARAVEGAIALAAGELPRGRRRER
ncbi:MAG: 4-hydroxythreonine-4-phosphate dehydrogenase PdxA [Thermoanaerobaculia bacterium]